MIALDSLLPLNDWLAAAGSQPAAQAAAIVAGTFILEDATTVAAALLVADGHLSLPVALGGLYSGIVLGDLWLYAMGRAASTHRRGNRLASHRKLRPLRAWLDSRMIETVFAVRFIPGLRLPTYTASGFFRLPLMRFVLTVIAATAVWTTGLFFLSKWFGAVTAASLGPWRWAVAGLAIGGLLLVGRLNARKLGYGESRSGAPPGPKSERKDGLD